MRRVMLLALLALSLPTAGLATSIDFSTGTFESGTISGPFTTSVNVSVAGSLNTISIETGTLKPISCSFSGATCHMFNGGSVTVASGGSPAFTNSLEGGFVIKTDNAAAITALLVPNSMVARGSTGFSFAFTGTALTTGSAGVTGVPTPEPSTLGLLGAGLIGLAGMAGRKPRPKT